MTRLQQSLWKIQGILEKYSYIEEAEYLTGVMEAIQRRKTGWRDLLLSERIWGGAGAIWEVGHLQEDTLLFWNLFIELALDMEEAGITGQKVDNVIAILRRHANLHLAKS